MAVLHVLIDAAQIVDRPGAVGWHVQHVDAEGQVGLVVAQHAQYGGHDVNLLCNLVLHLRLTVGLRLVDDDGRAEAAYVGLIESMVALVGMVAGQHEDGVLEPRFTAGPLEKAAQCVVGVAYALVDGQRLLLEHVDVLSGQLVGVMARGGEDRGHERLSHLRHLGGIVLQERLVPDGPQSVEVGFAPKARVVLIVLAPIVLLEPRGAGKGHEAHRAALCSVEEGGLVARIEDSGIGVPYVGPMGEVGASGDPAAAFEAGSTIGGYLHELGINLDFAPDADVLIDPYNQTIGNRSFGTDPFLCGQMVGRFIDGLHDQGVASCIKHFPGLGDTETDTHTGGAWSSRAIEDYRGAEFVSFQGGIEAGTDMVMVSHLSNTALTGSDLPASLNKVVMTDILRDELKFEGVIVTDSLQMGAVTERFDSAEAAVTALEAGADILLMPIDFQAARQGILDAVESGRISEKRIDQSLRRILMTRYRTGARRLDLRETGEAD